MRTPFKFKRFLLGLAIAVALTAVVAVLWPKPPAQIITLPTGEKLEFAGVTYGSKLLPPSLKDRIAAYLPNRLVPLAEKIGFHRPAWTMADSPGTPRLVVWFRQAATNASFPLWTLSIGARLADGTGHEGGMTAYLNRTFDGRWYCAAFPILPRRSPTLQCVIDDVNSAVPPQDRKSFGRVTFSNPRFGRFQQWQSEALPAAKNSGDVTATLEDVKLGCPTGQYGAPVPGQPLEVRYRPAGIGENPVTAYKVSFTSPRGTDELWYPHSAELTDATGNLLTRLNTISILPLNHPVPPWPAGGAAYENPLPGILWPDERAWHLKIHSKRVSGFAPDELITFKNVPVPRIGATNTPITNLFKGRPVVLRAFVRPGGTISLPSSIVFDYPGLTPDTAMDVIKLSADAGNVSVSGYSDFDFGCGVYLSAIPTNVTKLDITLAIQTTRAFDFFVKPPTAQ